MRPAMDMLMRVLDDGMSTRLYHRICDNKGLCYDVSASYDGYDDDGILDFAAGVQHARAAVVTTEITGLLADLARTGSMVDALFRSLLSGMLPTQALRAGGLWALKLVPPLRRQAFGIGMGSR